MRAMIHTVGHSNHPVVRFIALLLQHQIATLVDVRSTPASRFNPQFNRKALAASLAEHDVAYEFLGVELGARTDDPACYIDGRVSYERLAATPQFRRGLERVRTLAAAGRTALMCAEHDPLDCHRNILVGWELRREGDSIAHILRDGRLESQEEADARLIARLKLDADDLFAGGQSERAAHAHAMQAMRIAYVRPAARRRDS
jgi:uncharacterized protein (DUF488 family)